ncbi:MULTISPECIES: NADPH-dependent F420 reductase [unclassified Saccharothrix]|uniref:NADPH-dependent F420 reductase n=1 Tax=unclassified Saccharothrix TaxID=2593673 RepID=UPI00307D71D0
MRVGVVGAGNIGASVAKKLAKAGHDVLIANSRGPETLPDLDGVAKGTVDDALDRDVTFLAVPWVAMDDVTGGRDWSGKIVVDTSNPILPGFAFADIGDRPSSAIVAEKVPGARLVKGFNTLSPERLERDARTVIFLSGDDPEATKVVAELVESAGWAAVDLGSLETGGRLQQYPGGPLPGLSLVQQD